MSELVYNKKRTLFNFLLYFSFGLFLTILIWALFFKLNKYPAIIKNYKKLKGLNLIERLKYDLIPFARFSKKDFLLNILAFTPFGLYLPLIFKKHTFIKGILLCFAISFAIELTQAITIVGTFSTNDLIANTLGFIVGAIFFKNFIDRANSRMFNLLNTVVIFFASPFAVIGIINTVTNFSVYITKTL